MRRVHVISGVLLRVEPAATWPHKRLIIEEPIVTLNGSELHREEASAGYSAENISLVHHTCHRKQEADQNFT